MTIKVFPKTRIAARTESTGEVFHALGAALAAAFRMQRPSARFLQAVNPRMLIGRDEQKIFKAVVKLVAIAMVDRLVGQERPSNAVRKHHAMLGDVSIRQGVGVLWAKNPSVPVMNPRGRLDSPPWTFVRPARRPKECSVAIPRAKNAADYVRWSSPNEGAAASARILLPVLSHATSLHHAVRYMDNRIAA